MVKPKIHIHLLKSDDIPEIAAAFAQLGWNKPASQYEHYLKEQDAGERVVLVATIDGEFAGYVTILWESHYPYFWQAEIPEIVDFNVLPKFRQQGIGSQLMDEAERRIAERSPIAGIGVGLTADYGMAQILYVKRGYIPDGRGIVKDGKPLVNGERISIDDGVILYFTKVLIS
jgi:ribosomal protein S18 acetylase RimI-like enzyme